MIRKQLIAISAFFYSAVLCFAVLPVGGSDPLSSEAKNGAKTLCCSSPISPIHFAADEACSLSPWGLANCSDGDSCRWVSCKSSAASRYLGGCYNDTLWVDAVAQVAQRGFSCSSASEKIVSNLLFTFIAALCVAVRIF
jgi:hypothetical protein